MASFKE